MCDGEPRNREVRADGGLPSGAGREAGAARGGSDRTGQTRDDHTCRGEPEISLSDEAGGGERSAAEVKPAALEALLLDYEMGREDERVHSNLTVALVGVLAALLAGIAAIVTGDNHFKHGDGYDLPAAVSAFIPLLPLAVGGLLVMQGISATLRGLYLRQVEAALRLVAGTNLIDYRDLIAPSAHELNQAVISPIRGRPGYRALLALVLITNFVAYAGVIYLAAQTIDVIWVQVAMYVGYGALEIFCLYQVLGATVRGRTALQDTTVAIYAHLQYPYSIQRRQREVLVPRTGRSLVSYLLLPRPGELIKWLFVPVCYVLGTALVASWPPRSPLTFATAWLVFEYITYQARYQWNDIRGFVDDRRHRFASVRARLPVGRRGEASSVAWSLAVLLSRIVVSVIVVTLDPFGAGPYVLWASVAAWVIAVLYEVLRSGQQDTSSLRSSAVVVTAGGGYAIRTMLGVGLALGGWTPWVGSVLLSAAAWAFGIVFVTMTWTLDAFAGLRVEITPRERRYIYYGESPSGRSLLSKPHFLLLLRRLVTPVYRSGESTAPPNGERERPLREARDPRLPWNVSLVVSTTAGVAGLLALLPAPPGIAAIALSCGISLGGSLAMCLSRSPVTALAPFLLTGALLWIAFTFAAQAASSAAAGVGLWIVVAGLYLAFRRSNYADLAFAPYRALVGLDGVGTAILGSSWELIRPKRLGLLLTRAEAIEGQR